MALTITKSEFETLKRDFATKCLNENARNQFAETIKRNASIVNDPYPVPESQGA